MIKENYTAKIKQLENMVKQWGRRSITPIGKITVIKTFMISIFIHLFISLPNPSQAIMDYINNTIFSFLWNNKTSKIKQSVIIKQYSEGGLKMINIKAFIDALKTTWIRRLITTDSKWQYFIRVNIEMDKLLACGLTYVSEKMKHIHNNFWKDVLQAFINIDKKVEINERSVLKTPIFYNENIKIGNSYIFYSAWFKKGVRFINDLVKDKGEFTDNTRIQTNSLQYHGIIRAIKTYLKEVKINVCHKQNNPFIPTHILPFFQQQKRTKIMYNILNQNKDVPTGKITWNKVYNITDEDWDHINLFPFNITKYPALLWFQVTINHNILVTNKVLYQMKMRTDALCTLCQANNETITHLLW